MAGFEKETFDVCIIGAGPAGLSVLSALHNPTRLLTDIQLQTRDLRNVSSVDSQNRNKGEKSGSDLSICVVDPAGCWLCEWNGRMENIQYLRSPAMMSPDYNNNAALTRYASRTGRDGELKDVEIPRDASAELRTSIDGGLFKLPGSALFQDFCDDLVKSLPHKFITGSATDVKKRGDVYDIVGVGGGGASLVQARHVIFALGPSISPRIPKQIICVHEKCKKLANLRILHSLSWREMQTLPLKQETVVVVGGGLSAIQTVLLASRRGAKKVFLVSRRPLRSRLYDLSTDWFNIQAGWRTQSQNRKRPQKFRMYEFYDTPKSERKAWVRSARDGATVPPYYIKEFENASKKGRIVHLVDEIDTADLTTSLEAVELTFRQKGVDPVIADRVILATGSSLDVSGVPLLTNVIDTFRLPLVDGLPDLDEGLLWGEENFSVVGALAMMQIGPESGNLSGCRRCAERCASHLGVHDSMYEKNGPLINIYAAGFSDSSDDEEEEEEE